MASNSETMSTNDLQVLMDAANEKMAKVTDDYEGRTGMSEMFVIALSAESREELKDIAARVSDSLMKNDGILPKELYGDYKKLISHQPYDSMASAVSYDIGYSVKTIEECLSRIQDMDPDDIDSLETCYQYMVFLSNSLED